MADCTAEIVEFRRPGVHQELGGIVAQVAGVRLPKLVAAPMPVHIPIRADIDDEVVSVQIRPRKPPNIYGVATLLATAYPAHKP